MKNKLYMRVRQQTFRALSNFMNWRTPEIISGENPYKEILKKISKDDIILIVTDKELMKLGLLNTLIETLQKHEINYIIYDDTKQNPTITNVEEALKIFHTNNCTTIIAFGGGSPIDCGKIVAARAVCPNKSVNKMKGLLKIRKKIIPLIAVPTTAGTGSETTIAAIITDEKTHEKYVISDMSLIPKFAVLDYKLTMKLPKSLTATTGMDALTHAVESYIGKANTRQTKKDALSAIKMIYENLYKAYENGNDIKARKNMLEASFTAGKAFTRAYVGNVHSIAHQIGAIYNLPHGYANAVILPIVLNEYGNKIDKKLAQICDYIGLISENQTTKIKKENKNIEYIKAKRFIEWIEEMNKAMKIPCQIDKINNDDICLIAKRAYNEANPFYPVPEIWSIEKFENVIVKIKGENL